MKLEVQNLDYGYNKKEKVFENFNITFESGKIYAIVGDNGIGKTTLLTILAGLYRSNHGKILYNQKELSQVETKIITAFIPCNIGLYPLLDAFDHINLVAELWEMKSDSYERYKKKVIDYMDLLYLDVQKKTVEEYSNGMKYKLYLCLMLARDVEIVILDEPFTALDYKSQEMIIQLLKSIKSSCIIIFSSHQKEIVENFAEMTIDLNQLKDSR